MVKMSLTHRVFPAARRCVALLVAVLAVTALTVATGAETVTPVHAQAAGAAPKIEAAARDGAVRVTFDWPAKVDYSVVQAEKLVIVRFSKSVPNDVSSIARQGAMLFDGVRKGGNDRLVIFRLKSVQPIRHSRDGNSIEIVFGTPKPGPPQLVTLGVGKGEGFERLTFDWPKAVGYRFAPEAKRATLLFDRPARLRTAGARAALDRLGVKLTGRRVGSRLMVILEFKSDVRLRASSDGAKVHVDIFPVADAGGGGGGDGKGTALSARLEVSATANATDVRVDWPASVSAAVFRYGGFTWLVFGAPARFDLSNVKRKLGPGIEDIEQILLDNASILRLRTAGGIAASVSREGWQWHIRLAKGRSAARTSVYVRSDPTAPNGGRVMMRTGSAGSVISVTDPAVGSLLFIIPVSAPGLGMRLRRDYVKFRLLPTVQGLVVVPKADDLSVAVTGEEVEVTNPRGLALSGSN